MNWEVVLLSLSAAVLGSILTYYLAIRQKQREAMLRFREEKYSNLLVLLQGFIGVTASGDMKRKFFEEYYKSWLYCSDEVIKAIDELIELVKGQRGKAPDKEMGRKKVAAIVRSMREDLMGTTSLDDKIFQYTDVID